jgi:hypothetical protein
MWWKMAKDRNETDIQFNGLYRSMERQRGLKLAKWACWKMYHTHQILVDAETLLGYKKAKITEDTWNKVVGCRDWADEMLDYINVVDGRCNPVQMETWIRDYALKHGTLIHADNIGVKNGDTPGYFASFQNHGIKEQTPSGEKVFVPVKFGDREYKIYPMESVYIENNDKLFTHIIADHVGKFTNAPGMKPGKPTIDHASAILCDSRDIYNFSPVVISQFNRAIGDTNRIKHAGGDLAPILEDFKESGNTQEDADLVLVLFNPYRYKSFDDAGYYKGYNIKHKMLSPKGHNRYRLLTILKNSYGIDDVDMGMKFLGEIGHFETLPKVKNWQDLTDISKELHEAYGLIQRGL